MNGKKKVVLVNYSLEIGGIETLLLELSKKIGGSLFAPSLCVFERNGALQPEFERSGVPVHVLEKREGMDYRVMLRLARLLREREIDVVHTHNLFGWLYGGLAARLCGVPVIHTQHSVIEPEHRIPRFLMRYLARTTRVIVSVAESVARQLAEECAVPRDRIRVIHNGIDRERFRAAVDRRKIQRSLGIGEESPVAGIIARLVAIKDHATLLKAMALVRKELPAARLLIVGDGTAREGLRTQAKALGLAGSVHFLGNRRDIPELLRAMDLFVLSSLNEGLSVTLLEAMAAGVPVVATDVGGNREVVEHNRTGMLVPPGDPEKLAAAVGALLRDGEKRKALSRAGAARASRLFDLGHMTKEYTELYASV